MMACGGVTGRPRQKRRPKGRVRRRDEMRRESGRCSARRSEEQRRAVAPRRSTLAGVGPSTAWATASIVIDHDFTRPLSSASGTPGRHGRGRLRAHYTSPVAANYAPLRSLGRDSLIPLSRRPPVSILVPLERAVPPASLSLIS